MKEIIFMLCILILGGCAYYSKTNIYIHAKEASYPLGISGIKLKDGTIYIEREMRTKGVRNNEPVDNSTESISNSSLGRQ